MHLDVRAAEGTKAVNAAESADVARGAQLAGCADGSADADAGADAMMGLGFADGLKAALPVIFGYLPVGFAYGVLARSAGLSPFTTGAMSLLVYGGSSQFIAVDMIAKGAGAGAMIATTFLVNLRHLLFSAALSPRLGGVGAGRLAAISYGITDETFSVASATYPARGGNTSYLMGLNAAANISWLCASVVGALVGSRVGDPARLGLDYALTAMFICLLVFSLKSLGTYVAAVASALLGLALLPSTGSWSIIAAAAVGATVGVVMEEWKRRSY